MILAEVVLIVSFAVPLWGEVMNEQKIAQIKKDADSGKGLEIHILAKQFDWNARYAGNDNQFAAQSIAYANKTDNPFGIDNRDGAIDDVIIRSEEHTSELQSRRNLVCRLLLEKKK